MELEYLGVFALVTTGIPSSCLFLPTILLLLLLSSLLLPLAAVTGATEEAAAASPSDVAVKTEGGASLPAEVALQSGCNEEVPIAGEIPGIIT